LAVSVMHEYLRHAVYFAPRGKKRLLLLGTNIAQRYLSPDDRLIGLIGDAGAGKSLLIRGMFPGLELTNDDDGVNVRPLPLLADGERDHFRFHTYHLDVRFEMAFHQIGELAKLVKKALLEGKRVVAEHYDILHPYLQTKPDVLIGVGEEVIVTRPGVFGPDPQEIAKIVFHSILYRKMAHSAEDLTGLVLESKGITKPKVHSDIRHGFLMEFAEVPDIDLHEVENQVLNYINRRLPISYHDEQHIKIGGLLVRCTGPRIHLSNTGEISGFRLLKEFHWDPVQKLYTIAGLVGETGLEQTFYHR